MKKPQSLAGTIRQRLAEIEARLEVGVRQEVILGELAALGHQTSLQNFRNELWRARKWREKKVAVQKTQTLLPQTKEAATSKPVAAPQESTPKEGDLSQEDDADLAGKSQAQKDRIRRERQAQKFINDDSLNRNPFLKNLKKDKQ